VKRVLVASAALLALAFGGAANAATFTFSGSGGALPDRVDFSNTLAVGQDFVLQDVDLTLNGLTHTYWGDLDIFLSHAGVDVMVHDEQGASLDPNGTFTFDDDVAIPHTALNAAGGVFQPLHPLSAFDGLSSAGNWTLRIYDDAAADAGAFQGWTLTLTGNVVGEGAGVPEPAAWAMMLLGFFGLGSMVRASRRRSALAA
jgi:subtilisin-like proprotein convertase family protein